MHSVYDTILKWRTVRRFTSKPVSERILLQIADAARLAPSALNVQPCEFILVNQPTKTAEVFECIDWQKAVFPRGEPKAHERPTAYLIVLVDLIKKRKGGRSDAGAAAQNAILAAAELGLGSCWIFDFSPRKVKKTCRIPHHLDVDSVVAIGYPDENSILDEATDSVKPWTDDGGVVHVPKRRLADVCTLNVYSRVTQNPRKPA
jgi:nitroreductase